MASSNQRSFQQLTHTKRMYNVAWIRSLTLYQALRRTGFYFTVAHWHFFDSSRPLPPMGLSQSTFRLYLVYGGACNILTTSSDTWLASRSRTCSWARYSRSTHGTGPARLHKQHAGALYRRPRPKCGRAQHPGKDDCV